MAQKSGDIGFKTEDILCSKSTKYQITTFLGEGTYGKVAKCTNLSTKEEMAVKIVRKNLAYTGKREATILTELKQLEPNKNNLLKIIDNFTYMGHVCLAFEMLDISLFDLLRMKSFKPLNLSEIRVITQQMLVALNALMSINLIHADIKPDNIMLVNHNMQPFKLKLIDFGLARTVFEMKRGNKIQAIGYRAPEVFLGLPLNEAIDMWALGCVLAFLYLGNHLYPINCEYESMRVIVQMHGQPEDHLLNAGIHTRDYFTKDKRSPDSPWRLNTRDEYKRATGLATKPCRRVFDTFNSLDDLANPGEKDATEYEDTLAFLSLLKRMLHVDPEKRITPDEALGHRFITMKHLTRDTSDNKYVESVGLTIKNCQMENSSVEFEPFVTSSEVISWHGPSPHSLVDSVSSNEETAEDSNNGPQCKAAEKNDWTTATGDIGKTPASLLNEDETTDFVEVKTRRVHKFFTRMFRCFKCSNEDAIKVAHE